MVVTKVLCKCGDWSRYFLREIIYKYSGGARWNRYISMFRLCLNSIWRAVSLYSFRSSGESFRAFHSAELEKSQVKKKTGINGYEQGRG